MNLYAYCGNNPLAFTDPSGCEQEILLPAGWEMTKAQGYGGNWGFVLTKRNTDGTIADFIPFKDLHEFYEWEDVHPDFCDVTVGGWSMVGIGERSLSTGGLMALYWEAFKEGWSDGAKMTIEHDRETIERWGWMGSFSSGAGWFGEGALAGACGVAAIEMVGAAATAGGISAASGAAAGTGTPAATFYSGPGMQAAASAWATVNNGIMAANAGASANFARTVTGTAHVFQNAVTPMPRGGTIWETVEYPILVERGIDIVYHVWDGTQWIIQ